MFMITQKILGLWLTLDMLACLHVFVLPYILFYIYTSTSCLYTSSLHDLLPVPFFPSHQLTLFTSLNKRKEHRVLGRDILH